MGSDEVLMYILLAIIVVLIARSVYIEYKFKLLKRIVEDFDDRVRMLEKLLKNVSCFKKIAEKDLSYKSKVRKRYVVFRVICEKKPEGHEVESAILKTLARLYGEPFLNKAMINVVYYDKDRMKGIVRTTNEYKDNVIAGIGFVRRIGESKAIVVPVKTTGTIKRAREYIYGYE